jgi:hypothetical protein
MLCRTNRKLLLLTLVILFGSCTSRISDSQLHTEITSRLNKNDSFQSVIVNVKDGIVTLTGSVKTDPNKSAAASIAKIEGVKEVKNNIAVIPPTPEPTPASTEAPDVSSGSSYEDEAYDQARKYSDKMVSECHGSYFFGTINQNYRDIYECKYAPEITIDGKIVQPRQLSEADRLNGVQAAGIEWDGSANFRLRVCRYHEIYNNPNVTSSLIWTDWRDEPKGFGLNLRRVNGEWSQNQGQTLTFKGKLDGRVFNFPVSCSDVDKINNKKTTVDKINKNAANK